MNRPPAKTPAGKCPGPGSSGRSGTGPRSRCPAPGPRRSGGRTPSTGTPRTPTWPGSFSKTAPAALPAPRRTTALPPPVPWRQEPGPWAAGNRRCSQLGSRHRSCPGSAPGQTSTGAGCCSAPPGSALWPAPPSQTALWRQNRPPPPPAGAPPPTAGLFPSSGASAPRSSTAGPR